MSDVELSDCGTMATPNGEGVDVGVPKPVTVTGQPAEVHDRQ